MSDYLLLFIGRTPPIHTPTQRRSLCNGNIGTHPLPYVILLGSACAVTRLRRRPSPGFGRDPRSRRPVKRERMTVVIYIYRHTYIHTYIHTYPFWGERMEDSQVSYQGGHGDSQASTSKSSTHASSRTVVLSNNIYELYLSLIHI